MREYLRPVAMPYVEAEVLAKWDAQNTWHPIRWELGEAGLCSSYR